MRKLWLLVSCLVLAAGCFAQPQIIYYKFDETSGAAAKNHAIPGQGWNQGAFSAAPLWNTTTPQIPPAAVNNVGQNRRLNTGYSLAERNGQALTIELWFRTTGTGYQDFVNDSVNFGLWLNNGRIELQTSAGTIQSTNTNNNDGTWRYVAVTRNATNAWTLYWGTTAPGLTSVTGTMANTFTTNAMGLLYWQGASPATYSGEMDEFRLWSVQRTQAELEANRFASFLTQDIDVFDSSNIFVKHQGLAGFTNVASGVASNFTFTIRNMRPAGNVSFTPVTLGSITGATANVTVQPSTIAPGATTTFTIQVTPAQAEFTFTVNINNDRSPNPYTFTFNGMVNTGRPEMLYYRFNEGTGTTTRNDASPGRGNNPATFAAVSWTTTANARLGASAVQATTNLPTGFSCTQLPRPEFTLEFWVWRSGNATTTICGDGTSFRVYRQNATLRIQSGPAGGDQDISTGVNLANNGWTHIAIVSNPGVFGLRVYANGTQAFESINYTFPFANAQLFVMRNGGGTPTSFDGRVDEFRFWAHARTAAQIMADRDREILGRLQVERPAGTIIPAGGAEALGSVPTGAPQTLTYTLRNIGSTGLLLGNPALSFSGATNCSVNVTTNPSGTLLAASATTTAQVQVTPLAAGAFSCQLVFASNDPDVPSYTVNVSGTGVPGEIQIERPAGTIIADNGNDALGTHVAGVPLVLTYTVRNVAATGSINLGAFTVNGIVNCGVVLTPPGATPLAPGGSTTMQATVTPTAAGAFSFALHLANDDLDENPYDINASGTALAPPEINVQRPAGTNIADGGSTAVTGTVAGAGTPVTFTIQNLGGSTLNLTGRSVANLVNCGVALGSFGSSTVAAGGSTTLTVTVTPTAAGAWSFDLDIDSNDSDENPYDIAVSGTALVGGEINVERPAGTTIVDGGSDTVTGTVAGVATIVTYTIRNQGTATLTLTGRNAASLVNCGVGLGSFSSGSLAPGATATLSVSITPVAAGGWSFTLNILSDDLDENPYNIAVSGTATTGAEINVERPSGTTIADGGSDSVSGTVAGAPTVITYTIRNQGSSTLTLTGRSTANEVNCGVALGSFSSTNLAPAATATLAVTITPAAAGFWSFDLDINSNDTDENPYDIFVSGTAAPGGDINVERPAGTTILDGGSDGVTGSIAGAPIVITYTIRNTGPVTLTLTGRSFANNSNCNVVLGSFSSTSLAPSATATLGVTITPIAASGWSFDLDIDSDDLDESPYDIFVSGTAAPGGEINVERPAGTTILDGGSDSVSGTVAGAPTNITYTIRNQGTATLTLTGRSFANNSNCNVVLGSFSSTSLAPTATATLGVTITPVAAGGWSFDLDIDSDDLDEATYDIFVSGTALVGGEINVERPAGTTILDGGSDSVSGTVAGAPTNITYTIRNQGTATLTLTGRSFANAGNCNVVLGSFSSTSLAPSATATLDVTITPVAAGVWSFDLDIDSDDLDEATYDIAVSGTALVGGEINVERPAGTTILDGGSDSVSGTVAGAPANITYTIRNQGTATLTLTGRSFANNSNCNVVLGSFSSTSLAPSATATLDVTITPIAAGGWSFDLDIDSDDLDEATYDIFVSGTAQVGGEINVERPAGTTILDGGSDTVTGTSAGSATIITYTIRNQGTATLTLTGRNVTSLFNTNVALGAFSSSSLAPAATATLNVAITPLSAGGWSFTLNIFSDDLDEGTYDIAVSGTAVPGGEINVERPAGTTIVDGGSDSVTGTVAGVATLITYTIRNQGTATLTLTGRSFANNSNCNVVLGTFSSTSLAPSATATLNVTITPIAAGAWSFDLDIASDDVDENPYDIAVSGTAAPGGEIDVQRPAGNPIADGGSDSVTGTVSGTPTLITYTIRNFGSADLTLTGRSFANNSNCNVVLGSFSSTNLSPLGTATLDVTITPIAAGGWSFDLDIDSDDLDEATYDIAVSGNALPASSVTGVTVSPDDGGPLRVSATVNGTPLTTIDVVVTYTGGANAGPPVLVWTSTGTISGNTIVGIPANSSLEFVWDAYATERHATDPAYVLTLQPFIGALPGAPGLSPPFALSRDGGWAKHLTPGEQSVPLFGHVAVFDAANDRMVIFGGRKGSIRSNETWVYQRGAAPYWRRIYPAGTTPAGRQYAAAVYDAAGQRMIVFGGFGNSGALNDAWQLSLGAGTETWTQIAAASPGIPAARYGHSLVLDAGNNRVLMHGGLGSTYLNDTWALDLGTSLWGAAAISTGGPGRNGHAAVLDAAGNRMVVYGGHTTAGTQSDVWQMNLTSLAWSAVSTTGTPGARYFSSYLHDTAANRLITCSGYNGSTVRLDGFILDLQGPNQHVWTPLAQDEIAATGRVQGSAVMDPARLEGIFYGGLNVNTQPMTGLSILALGAVPVWTPPASVTAYPAARWGAVMVHDTFHDRLVLWGGKDASSYFGDVWVLDRSVAGAAWQRLSVTGSGPATRVYAAGAYDALNRRLLISGGQDASGVRHADLWSLDLSSATGASWTQHAAGGPAGRIFHTLVYDSVLDRAVLFGGLGTTNYNDVWIFDFAAPGWVQHLPGLSPDVRQGHGAIYDAVRQRMVIFAGRNSLKGLNDVWALDLNPAGAWTNISQVGGTPMNVRSHFAWAANAAATSVWIHSGNGAAADLWHLDLGGTQAAWAPVTLPGGGPGARTSHNAVMDGNDLLVGFGLEAGAGVRDLWRLDVTNPSAGWQLAGAPLQPPGLVHSHVERDAANHRLIAFGGFLAGANDGELWQLDLNAVRPAWARLAVTGPRPGPRRTGTMVYDAAGGRMILYGGRTGIANSTITDEVWALDLTPGSEQWTLLTTSGASPGRRAQHVAVLAGPGRMVIFGGASETGAIQNTTFELNLNTLVWSQIAAANAPLPRLAAAAVYDPAGQRMLLYGGLNGGALGTFHALNLTGAPVWTTLTKTGTAPPSLYYHSMVYDAALHRVLLFGGFGSEAANGLYVLDVATLVWSLTAPPVAQPQRRWGHGAVWDPVGARMVMVGGFIDGEIPAVDSDGFADTWFWGD